MHRGILRLLAIAAVVGSSFAVAAPASAVEGSRTSIAPTRKIAAVNQLESGVLGEVNALRRSHGLVPLKLNNRLTAAADFHSKEMASKGIFSHESPDGSAFWKRVQRFYGSANYRYWSVGENLVWASPDMDAKYALELWLGSPEHKKNLLTPRWREIGLSAVKATAAPGVFSGLDVTIITANFGVRSR